MGRYSKNRGRGERYSDRNRGRDPFLPRSKLTTAAAVTAALFASGANASESPVCVQFDELNFASFIPGNRDVRTAIESAASPGSDNGFARQIPCDNDTTFLQPAGLPRCEDMWGRVRLIPRDLYRGTTVNTTGGSSVPAVFESETCRNLANFGNISFIFAFVFVLVSASIVGCKVRGCYRRRHYVETDLETQLSSERDGLLATGAAPVNSV